MAELTLILECYRLSLELGLEILKSMPDEVKREMILEWWKHHLKDVECWDRIVEAIKAIPQQ